MLPTPANPGCHTEILVAELPSCIVGAEGHACLGVDIEAAQHAPGRESVRVNYRAVYGQPIPFEFLQTLAGLFLPRLETGWQDVRVGHDGQHAFILITAVP